MTLLEVEELTRYWIDHPPTHLMVAAHLGIGNGHRGAKRSGSAAATPAGRNLEVAAVLAELGPSFAAGDVHAGLAPVSLDFADLSRRVKSSS